MISISGAACSNWPVIWPTSRDGRNNRPFFSKKSPEPSGCIDTKFFLSSRSLASSAAAAELVSSGVAASTTAKMVLSRSNALSNWTSRWRQSIRSEIRVLMSVLMAKCFAV
jgi:hypothetical protein